MEEKDGEAVLRFPLAVLTRKGILVVFIARCCESLSYFFYGRVCAFFGKSQPEAEGL